MKTILSIDGGGMKGFIPCSFLVELERRAGKSCADIFDLAAGTSIGGILACLIATGRSATEALTFFTDDGPNIFGHIQTFGHNGYIEPRYGADRLEAVLQKKLGTATLLDCKLSLMIPAFDLVDYMPVFFRTPFPGEPHVKPYALWQVARATSAAQTYFPAFEMDGMILWDGGNVANNPAVLAVAEALRLWPGEELRILSLGCGGSKSKIEAKKLINAGMLSVGIETMGLLFDAGDELPDHILGQFMPRGYFRVQPQLAESLTIDGADANALRMLQDEAARSIRHNGKTIDDFLSMPPKASVTETATKVTTDTAHPELAAEPTVPG